MRERLTFNYGTSTGDTPPFAGPGGEPRPSDAAAVAVPTETEKTRRDFAFLGLMLFTAVLFFRPQDVVKALRPLHLAELTALCALTALVWGRLSRGLPVTRFSPELAGVFALGGVILCTAPFGVWMGGSINTFIDPFLKVLLIFLLMVNTLTSPRRLEQFTLLIVSALAYLAVRAVFDYARGVNLIENGRVQGAVGGIFKNPNDLALNLVTVLPLAMSFGLRPGSSPARRAMAAACVVVMVAATVATQSRTGTIGLVVMGALVTIKLVRIRPGLVAAGAFCLALALPFLPQSYTQRVASIADPSLDDTGSREARRILLREAADAFVAHPLTGVGAGQFVNYNPEGRQEAWREAHNVLLQVAAELGLFGLICFGFLVSRAFLAPMQTRRLLRRFRSGGGRERPDAPVLSDKDRAFLETHQMAVGAAVAGWFVCALFGSVAYNWTFYYILGMAIAPRNILADRLKSGIRLRRPSHRMVAAPARV